MDTDLPDALLDSPAPWAGRRPLLPLNLFGDSQRSEERVPCESAGRPPPRHQPHWVSLRWYGRAEKSPVRSPPRERYLKKTLCCPFAFTAAEASSSEKQAGAERRVALHPQTSREPGGIRTGELKRAPSAKLGPQMTLRFPPPHRSMPYQVVVHPEPPDGGWGWMVVLAAFIQSALVFGVIRSFGIFFVEFVEYFDDLSRRISWITSIGIAVQQFASPVSSALSTRYGARPVVMAGGIFSSLGLFLASFATSLAHLYLCIGLLSGFGWALVFTPSMASMARYFKARRTLVTGVALTGVGLSSFAFSPLFQLLVDTYAWRGALMVVSGMSFNLVVCGALIRPLTLKEDLAGPTRVDPASGICLKKLSSLFGLHLLSHWPFMRFVLAVTLINTGYFIPYVHLVARARELGFDEYEAAFLMSVAAVADLCGRLFSGWLGNCRTFRLVHILVTWTSLTGVSLLLIPWGQSYPLLVGISLCYGFFSGALTPVVFSIIPEIVGIRNIFSSMGLLQMIESIGGLLGAPLSGFLRDITGNYVASFLTAGSFLLAGSLVLVTLPTFSMCRTRPAPQEPEATVEAGKSSPLGSAPLPVGAPSPPVQLAYEAVAKTEKALPQS